MNKQQGFTLIEVVLAIAVGLIIIAGVAVGYQYAKKSAIADNQRKDVSSVKPLSESETAPKQAVITAVTPASKTEFTLSGASAVTLKWNTATPKPEGSVTYRIKVWQLMEGQSGAQAMKTNQPIVTKDVDNMTEATINGIYTGPCKPPYLCDFIWDVEVVTKNSSTTGTTGTPGVTGTVTNEPATTGTR